MTNSFGSMIKNMIRIKLRYIFLYLIAYYSGIKIFYRVYLALKLGKIKGYEHHKTYIFLDDSPIIFYFTAGGWFFVGICIILLAHAFSYMKFLERPDFN